MGVPMNVRITGLECTLTHEPSGSVIRTIPPKDNGGDGSTFSPTDLVGAALASCVLSTMEITMPPGTKPEQRARFEELARGCPVARSLHPEAQIPMTFIYP